MLKAKMGTFLFPSLFVRGVTDVKLVVARAHAGCAAAVCIVADPVAATSTIYYVNDRALTQQPLGTRIATPGFCCPK
jgi:hypothetical protein